MSTLDVVGLRDFYATPLGRMVKRILRARIQARWDNVVGLTVLGLGYAPPFLNPFRADALRTMAFMPAEQGVVHWPRPSEPSSTALVEEDALPLPAGSVDRALLVHALEVSRHPADLLRELWRSLDGGGRLILIVPSRRGWWSGAEWTPFGHGRPYSRSQLTDLLRETLFSPLDWSEALYLPPTNRTTLLRAGLMLEKTGRAITMPFAGVHIVEATKQVYSAIPTRRASRLAAQLRPVLAPIAEPRRTNRTPVR